MNYILLAEFCAGGGRCRGAYLQMFVTFPVNYLYLATYSTCMGVLLGQICASYNAASVGLVFGLTAGMIVGLTLFAVSTKTAFTGCGMYIFVALLGFLMLLVLGLFVPGVFFQKAVAVLGAVLFSFVIVHDTQL